MGASRASLQRRQGARAAAQRGLSRARDRVYRSARASRAVDLSFSSATRRCARFVVPTLVCLPAVIEPGPAPHRVPGSVTVCAAATWPALPTQPALRAPHFRDQRSGFARASSRLRRASTTRRRARGPLSLRARGRPSCVIWRESACKPSSPNRTSYPSLPICAKLRAVR